MAGTTAKRAKTLAQPAPKHVWYTRRQAWQRLGLSESGLRARVRLKLLEEYKHPTNGRPVYRSDEVDALALRMPARRSSSGGKRSEDSAAGELSARAFALFRTGLDLRRAVVELKITAAEAEQLAHDYTRLGGEVLIGGDGANQVSVLLGGHKIATEAELIAAIRGKAEDHRDEKKKEVAKAEAAKETTIAELRAQLAAVERERDEQRARAERLTVERDEMRSRAEALAIAHLQVELAKQQAASSTGPASEAATTSAPESAAPPPAPDPSTQREPG